jgi:hypothetical protein
VTAALAAAGLAGCDGAPGAAATIDGATIVTEREVDQATAGLNEISVALGQEPTATRDLVLTRLAVARVYRDMVAQTGNAALIEAAKPLDRDGWESALTDAGLEEDQVAKVLELNLTASECDFIFMPSASALQSAVEDGLVEEDAILERQAQIMVNPRYGTFDPNQGVVASSYPWKLVPPETLEAQEEPALEIEQ